MSTVLMVHGMWCTGAHLAQISTRLSIHGHRAIAPTLVRGPTVGLADYVDQLENKLISLRLEQPPILLGHSLGG